MVEFGDYVYIEQKRFGVPNEQYLYKVIGTLRSNTWVDVPVMAGQGKAIIHHDIETLDGLEDIVRCVCCGVCEEEVQRFRLKDVIKRQSPTQHNHASFVALVEGRLSEIDNDPHTSEMDKPARKNELLYLLSLIKSK